ncbi:hypothetical protein [Ancylobacter sp. G4_0304]|uniref:hypothetical protein n=1 Tax=Ancylobacter sp. G4_0304 TaxID=3114289 RepID=UPI0039C73972
MSYRQPNKADLDRALSAITHRSRHKAKSALKQITFDLARSGMLQSSVHISSAMDRLDAIHKNTLERVANTIHDFIERMDTNAAEVAAWSRPLLENMGVSLLGELPMAGFPNEHRCVQSRYALVFQQRLDLMLADVPIGFDAGRNVAKSGDPIFSAKPGMGGMSINLIELWRRKLRAPWKMLLALLRRTVQGK